MNELLQKDTLIDKQAVMNKDLHKELDALKQQLKESNASQAKLKSMVEVGEEEKNDMQRVIEEMKNKLDQQADQNALQTDNYKN